MTLQAASLLLYRANTLMPALTWSFVDKVRLLAGTR